MNFDDLIFAELSHIPFGHTISYGQLARQIGYANHARQVARTLKNLPKDTQLPWHRVINSQGKISLPKQSDAYTEQRARLLSEGVPITNDTVKKPYFLG
ncbi:MAG: cysteine methyltransferase [Bermanella sp.]|nr:cysteine methyltransferase [Bermanella sp.]|tara:strand:- start:3352 stop:3648 length:297 start_codon:yes stop_codon:yes gene_type:complete